MRADADAEPDLPAVKWVGEFAKIGRQKQEKVLDGLDLQDMTVYDLAVGDEGMVRELYDRMKEASDPYTERDLRGKIGGIGPSLKDGLINYLYFINRKSEAEDLADDLEGFNSLRDLCIYYSGGKVISGEGGEKDMPFVFELAAVPKGRLKASSSRGSSEAIFGINQSVAYSNPRLNLNVKYKSGKKKHCSSIRTAFDRTGHDYFIAANLTCPNLDFQDKGKQNFNTTPFEPVISNVVGKAVRKIERDIRPRLNDLLSEPGPDPETVQAKKEFERKRAPSGFIKEFVYRNFDKVYNKETNHGEYTLPMQNFYYKMRKLFSDLVERTPYEYSHNASFDKDKDSDEYKKLELKKGTFQKIVERYEEEELGKRVIYREKRGFFVEPHTNREIELSTKAVENYDPPEKQFGNLLYVEKEGYYELLHKDFELTKKYDIGLINAKGTAVNAARDLVEKIQRKYDDVNLYILTDLDIRGVGIAEDAKKPDDVSSLQGEFDATHLGVTLEDVKKYDLPIESRDYSSPVKNELERKHREGKVSDELYEFFLKNGGQGVQINAFGPPELRDYLVDKFEEHGIEKVKPNKEDIEEPEVESPEKLRERALLEAVGEFVMMEAGEEVADVLEEKHFKVDNDPSSELRDLMDKGSEAVLDAILEKLEKFPPKGWREIRDEEVKEIESSGEKKAEKLVSGYKEKVLDFLKRYASAAAEIENKEVRRLRRMLPGNSKGSRKT